MDSRTEAAVERVRKALRARADAAAREEKAHGDYLAAKGARESAETEVTEAQAALRSRLLAAPEPEPPATPAPAPATAVPAPVAEAPAKKPPAKK